MSTDYLALARSMQPTELDRARMRREEREALRRLRTPALNEWGIPEPTPAQEAWAEDVDEYAGCPDTACDDLTLCDPCGMPVCDTHSDFPADCAEGVGLHHERCRADCVECSAAAAQDHDGDRAERFRRERW